MNLFSEFFFSIFGVKKYPRFLQNKGGKAFLYLMFAVLIYTAIANAKAFPAAKNFVTEIKELIQTEIPDFELKNGELHIDQSFYFEEDGIMFSADSEYGSYIKQYEKGEWLETLEDYNGVLMFDATSMLYKDDDSGRFEIVDYPTDWSFDRDMIYGVLDYTYWLVAIYLVLAYICNIIGFLFGTLIVALLGLIIDSFIGCNLTYGQLFKLSIYAKTCMLMVKAVLRLCNVSFFGLFVLVISISCLYLGCALSYKKNQDEQEKRYGDPIIY